MEIFRTKHTLYIVMELCAGGELFDLMAEQPGRKFKEDDARGLVKQMVVRTLTCAISAVAFIVAFIVSFVRV